MCVRWVSWGGGLIERIYQVGWARGQGGKWGIRKYFIGFRVYVTWILVVLKCVFVVNIWLLYK